MLSAIQVRKYDVSDIPNNDSGCKMSVSGKDKVSFVMRIYGTSRVCVCVCVCVCVYVLRSFVQLFVTPWTIACQAPLSMEFSRQEYWLLLLLLLLLLSRFSHV